MSATEVSGQIAVASGLAAFAASAMGLDPAAVVYAIGGSVFGVLLAKAPDGMTGLKLRLYTIAAFLAASLISAQWAGSAVVYMVKAGWIDVGSGPGYIRAIAPLISMSFHPIIGGVMVVVPKIVQAVAERAVSFLGGQK